MAPKLQPPLKETYPYTQLFGDNPSRYRQFGFAGHEGIDWGAPAGTPVYACADGVVESAVQNGPYGLHVRIRHDGFNTIYAHLSSVNVKGGQIVRAGQHVGRVGSTGNSTGPHLHLTLKVDGAKTPGFPGGIVDPMPYLYGTPAPVGQQQEPEPLQGASQPAPEQEPEDQPKSPIVMRMRVTAEASLNVRSGPGTQYKIVDMLALGTPVDVQDIVAETLWVKIAPGRFVACRFNGEQHLEQVNE